MPVSFNSIIIGSCYTRPNLAELWGYKTHQAISRGIVTPKGTPYIILFVTKVKQSGYVQYRNEIFDDLLHTQGETNHISDNRIIGSIDEHTQIHLFYRERHHSDFIYYGKIYLVSYELKRNEPSSFVYAMTEFSKSAFNSMGTEIQTHSAGDSPFIPDEEGRKKLVQHYAYERSIRNRARALEIHGTVCAVCGFDFNKVYGEKWAQSYIEIHHTRSVTTLDNTPVDPVRDLVPLCSNCHSMAHKFRGEILSVESLKTLITKNDNLKG